MKATLPRKISVTFRDERLESDFVAYCRREVREGDRESLIKRSERFQTESIDFIASRDFSLPNAEREILGGVLLGTVGTEQKFASNPRRRGNDFGVSRLCESPLLTAEEEWRLFRRMNFLRFLAAQYQMQSRCGEGLDPERGRVEGLLNASNWHRDVIVSANLRLVMSIVKRFVSANNVFDDLLSDGIMALMRAVDKFDYGRGFRFSTYATQVLRRNAYRIVMEKQVERLQVTVNIHDAGVDISDRESNSSMSLKRWNDLRSRLGDLLNQLDRREKLIVRARFSLGSHRRVRTLQYIADKLGVSKERVRQIEKRALDKLRNMASQTEVSSFEF